jgi:hypothetical protein
VPIALQFTSTTLSAGGVFRSRTRNVQSFSGSSSDECRVDIIVIVGRHPYALATPSSTHDNIDSEIPTITQRRRRISHNERSNARVRISYRRVAVVGISDDERRDSESLGGVNTGSHTGDSCDRDAPCDERGSCTSVSID